MNQPSYVTEALIQPFGTALADKMAIAHYRDGAWQPFEITDVGPLSLSPAAHVLHYGSTCFEGMKVHRWADGSVHSFRIDAHAARLAQSSEALCLPRIEPDQFIEMVSAAVRACADWVPQQPASLYVRPTLIGTLPSIGAAAAPSPEATFFVILAPVGEYFKGGNRGLRILIEDQRPRTSPSTGFIKTGGNYAAALGSILKAKRDHQVDQVLFAPDDDVQETGAANFLMLDDQRLITKDLDPSFLHGITRDSLLKLGEKLGYTIDERPISVAEVLDHAKHGEAALSGTAAILGGISHYIYQGQEYRVGEGVVGPNTTRMRHALLDIKEGRADDCFGWMSRLV